MPWSLRPITQAVSVALRPVAKLGRYVPALPWPVWAIGAGAGAALLLSAGAAGAAAAAGGDKPPRPDGAPPLIKLGASGAWVSYLQGLLGVQVSGTFDSATDEAVRKFQGEKKITVDGVVGPGTWGALGVAAMVTPGPAPAPKPKPAPSVPAPAPKPSPGNVFGLSDVIGERDGQILAYVNQGKYTVEFVPLTWSSKGRTITAYVAKRALALWDGENRLIVTPSYNAAQKIADMLGAILLTTRVSDEIWKQAPNRLGSLSHNDWVKDGTMAKTSRMIEQNALIESKVGLADGLVANEGKDWVLTRRNWLPPAGTGEEKKEGAPGSRHNGANFGLYGGPSKSPGGEAVWQSVGLVHDRNHADYSQLWRGMLPIVEVDGQTMSAASVLADPELSYLLNDEGGTLPAVRHPDL